jgi:PAS domain S-box-containing protein
MQDLSEKIRNNLKSLTEAYSEQLEDIPSYREFSKETRVEIARDDLEQIATCLETENSAKFIELTRQKATERLEQGFAAKPLMQALTIIEEILSPLVSDVETTKFLWKMLSEARNTVSLQIAQDTFNKQREFLWRVIDALPSFVFVRDRDGRFVLANQALAESYNTTVKEIVGKTDADLNPNIDEVETIRSDDLAVMETQEDKMIPEQIITDADGNRHWMQVIKRPLVDDDGVSRRVLGIANDITQRKKLEHEIQTSLNRRSRQVETSTEISQEIAAASDLEEIYERVVKLVKERFGYYHAQIFRYDEDMDAMRVEVGYGEAGRKMKAAKHNLPYGKGVVGTAAATGEPVLASNAAKDPDWVPHPDLPLTQGELAVPIEWRDEVLGVLDVQHEQAGALTEEDQVLLMGLAGQVAAAIHNARLYQALERQQYLMNALMENVPDKIYFKDTQGRFLRISKSTAESFGLDDPEEAIGKTDHDFFTEEHAQQAMEDEQWVMQTGEGITKEERETWPDRPDSWVLSRKLPLYNEEGEIVGTFGISTDITERKQVEAEMEETLQELERLNRLMSREGWEEYRQQAETWGYRFDLKEVSPLDTWWIPELKQAADENDLTRSPGKATVAPLSLRGEIIGALGIEDDPERPITEEESALIETLAEEITEALESARLFDQTQQALSKTQVLYNTSFALIDPRKSVSDMLKAAADGIVEALSADRVAVITINQNEETIRDIIRSGPGADKIVPIDYNEIWEGLSGWAIRNRQPAISPKGKPDHREEPYVQQRRAETDCGSIIVVPMFYRTTPLGTITAINRPDQLDFVQQDAELMLALANQAASSLENARLLEQTQQALREAETLNAIAQNLGQMNSEEEMFEFVLPRYLDYLNLSQGGIVMLDEGKNHAVLKALVKDGKLVEPDLVIPIAENAPLQQMFKTKKPVAIFDAETSKLLENARHLPETFNYKSILLVPIFIREEIVGFLGADSVETRRAFSEEEIGVIQTVADQLAIAIANTRSLAETQKALDELEATQRLYLREQWEKFIPERITPFYERRREGMPPLDQMIPPAAQDAIREQAIVRREEDGSLAAPLLLRGETIGVLGLQKPEGAGDWTEDEVALVETVVEQLAIAMESARLLDESQRRSQRDRLVADITAKVRSSSHVETIMKTAVRELGAVLDTDRARVYLKTQDDGKTTTEPRESDQDAA